MMKGNCSLDYAIYDEIGDIPVNEGRYSLLETFLASPDFERYYSGLFDNRYLFLLGNKIKTVKQKEDYEKWYYYCQNSFDGTIVCPYLDKNLLFWDYFNQASIFFFCVYQNDSMLEQMILRALANKADVIIQLYEEKLYSKYSKKYKQATIILAGHEEDTVLNETDSFMVSCYNRWKGKVYRK